MKKLTVFFATLVLLFSLPALAQTHKPSNVHPVPAPSLSIAHEDGAKEPAEAEEGGPGPIEWWSNKVLGNPRVSYGAVVFNFVLLLLLYKRLFGGLLVEALKTRKKSIASAIENAQKILSEARQRAKKYKHKLEKAEADATEARQGQIDTGKGDAAAIVRNAEEKAARLSRDVQFIVEQEQKQTQLDLVRETVEKAAKEAEDLLRTNVGPADQERLAEEFLSKLTSDYEKGLPIGGAS